MGRMTPQEALGFVERHGVVLAAARGPVPTLAYAVAGESIRGSWWGHPAGKAIFAVMSALDDSPDVVACRLVNGKVTWVHRRLWPALARVAPRLPPDRIAAACQEHMATGAHRAISVPFAEWISADALAAAEELSEVEAIEQLGAWIRPMLAERWV